MDAIKTWVYCLSRIFKLPASIVLIIGDWKTGKTDFSLKLFEELMRLAIIKKGATKVGIFQSLKEKIRPKKEEKTE